MGARRRLSGVGRVVSVCGALVCAGCGGSHRIARPPRVTPPRTDRATPTRTDRATSAHLRIPTVQIEQDYTPDGQPTMLDNLGASATPTHMAWLVCPAGGADCVAATRRDGLRLLTPDTQALMPGRTPPGTFFRAAVRVSQRTYTARSSTWLGTVRAIGRPRVRGEVRVGARVQPVAGRWSGGWSPRPVAHEADGLNMGMGPSVDELNLEACRDISASHCLNLSPQREPFCLYSPGAVRIPARFVGWYLFAFDRREPANQACAEPGFTSAEAEPVVRLSATAVRSPPAGPIGR